MKVFNLHTTTGVVLFSTLLTLQTCTPCLAAPPPDSGIGTNALMEMLEPTKEDFSLPHEPLCIQEDQQLQVETPILDSQLDKDLLSQASPTGDVPVLRQGISSSPHELGGKIDDLAYQILLKEIELERYSINYNMTVAKQGRWKGWRYATFQEANSGLGLAGGIISVANRGAHLHRPAKVKRRTQEAANWIPMIGAIIGAAAAVNEFGVNEWHEMETRKKGFSPKQAREKVRALRTEIDTMLDQRAQLVVAEASEPALQGRVEIDRAEDAVLKDLRDQKLEQFERFHLGKRRLLAFQQAQYLFDCAKFTTNAIGFGLAYQSIHARKRIYNGRAGVLFEVSGGLTMLGPMASRLYGKVVADVHRRLLKPTTQVAEDATVAKLKADHELLDKLAKEKETTPEKAEICVHRSTIYASDEKRFEDEIRASEKANDKAKLTATQNVFGGLYVGGSKVASGIMFLHCGFDSRFNRKGYRSDKVTNNDLFAAAVIGVPASLYSIVDTLRININGEIARHKQLKAGTHPSQLAKARLKELDDLEQNIKARL